MRQVIPSYQHQIEKAVHRKDLISINHRIAALLASYFDVIFALNYQLNPGEKRVLETTLRECKILQAWKQFFKGLFTEPIYWRFTKQVLSKPGMIFQFMKHIGYGIYVGKKEIPL